MIIYNKLNLEIRLSLLILKTELKNRIKKFARIKKILLLHFLLKEIVRWCNGNTEVFGAFIQGSSPCRTTKEERRIIIMRRSS